MKTLVKNIRAIDPALGLDEVCDILIDGDQIVERPKPLIAAKSMKMETMKSNILFLKLQLFGLPLRWT